MAALELTNTPYKPYPNPSRTGMLSLARYDAEYERTKDQIKLDPSYALNQLGISIEESRNRISRLSSSSDVSAAFRAIPSDFHSAEFYVSVAELLNIISKRYVEQFRDTLAKVIAFGAKEREAIRADWMNVDMKPDWVSYTTTYDGLTSAMSNPKKVATPSFNNLVGVGEKASQTLHKHSAQMSYYMTSLKVYRADLTTVHGLFVDEETVVLWSHNACGISTLPEYPCSLHIDVSRSPGQNEDSGNIHPGLYSYVLHVVLLYNSLEDEVPPLKIGRDLWKIEITFAHVDQVPDASAFHATKGPGRMTWVASVTSGLGGNTSLIGIIKLYWEDIDSVFHEADILDHAHELEYLPGIVRQLLRISYDKEIGMAGFRIRRRLRVIFMSSYGRPLSQCRDAMHLLKVAYDGILGIVSIGFVILTTCSLCDSTPTTSSSRYFA